MDLRAKIIKIKSDNDLTEDQKSKKIFELMNPNYKKLFSKEDDNFNYDIKGCCHYERGCLLKAECCGKLVPCRLCHDEKLDHKINRFDTKEMMCKFCEEIQPVSQKCVKCNNIMGNYYCNVCKFWSNNKNINIFHCDLCGICRIGLKNDYFHCQKCGNCIKKELKDNHTCLEKCLHVNCPICNEYLFTSVKPSIQLKCGHYIHAECYKEYINNNNYQCPICKKTILDIDWSLFDAYIESQSMPEEYKHTYCLVYCNDCESKVYSNYHFIYNKCKKCNGYNTSLISTNNITCIINTVIKFQRKCKLQSNYK